MTSILSFVNTNYVLLEDFMKFSEVMIFYDYNMSKIAKALETSRQYVAQWKKADSIPYPKQCELQIITNGKLIANKED